MIAIDIDGVIANSEEQLRNMIERETGIDFSPSDPRRYSFHDAFVGVDNNVIHLLIDKVLTVYSHTIEMYDPLNTLISLAELAKCDNKVHFLTSRNPEISEYTYEWLEDNIGCIPFSLSFSANKSRWLSFRKILSYDGIIEDRLKTANECAEYGFDVYLINRPWNMGRDTHPSVVRFDNVSDAIDMYLKKKDC